MSRKYFNSPIIEAVCEFKFSDKTNWDLTIPGLMYEEMKKEYPEKGKRTLKEINIDQSSTDIPQKMISTVERAVFMDRDKTSSIQIGHNVVAITFFKPYPTWEIAKDKIKAVYESLRKKLEIKGFERIGLRYINRIEIPGTNVQLKDYFDYRPCIGDKLNRNIGAFMVGTLWTYSEKSDNCNIRLSNEVSDEPNKSAFMLDLDYFTVNASAIKPDNALDWLEKGHSVINESFEGCITDKLRKIFDNGMNNGIH